MKSIFPYNEKIVKEGGAFVKPDGEFIMACYNHEGYARDYCDGYYAKILEAAKKGEKFPSFPTFEDIKKIYDYEGILEDIDIYLSSNLTKEQLKLYKLWLELNRDNEKLNSRLASEFLIRILSWDKIDTIAKNEIVTSSPNPYYIYWNYYLMGFDIINSNPLTFNNLGNLFKESLSEEYLALRKKDNLLKEEADEIKAKCKRKNIEEFFRK